MLRATPLHASRLLRIVPATFVAATLVAAMAVAAMGWAFTGCTNELRRPDPVPRRIDTVGRSENFHMPAFEEGRILDTVMTIDFNGSGKPEYVIASKDSALSLGRADLITIYAHDSVSRGYIQRVNHLVIFARAYNVADVTGDGRPELIVYTWGGGNDMVASNGVVIYSDRKGEITRIYQADHGAPALDALPGETGQVIMLHSLFWPDFMSHGDAQMYLNDILGYRKGEFVSVRRDHGMVFRTLAQSSLDEYRTLRVRYQADTIAPALEAADSLGAEADSLDSDIADATPHPLFVKSALAMILLGRAEERASIRSFWSSEKGYLSRRIPQQQFEELEKVYGRAMGLISESER